jgi:CubicO group peptidase (beta-lactamase class C family)
MKPFKSFKPARVLITLFLLPLFLAVVPVGKPEDVGMSTERLQRINQVIQRAMDAKSITGAVTVVSRKGRLAHFEAQGSMDLEAKTPMRKDAIFRMASMTKPVAGVAILMLMEEGKVRLSDPVSRFIPEFKDTRVAVAAASSSTTSTTSTTAQTAGQPATAPPAAGRGRGRGGPAPELSFVPARRAITVRDLMTHTAGLGSGGIAARETARIAPRSESDTLATYIPKLGAAPLDFQPGTEWRYSGLDGIDTLGRIVEVASGLTFDQFLKQRIFDPLGMKDTTFVPQAAQMPRAATVYRRGQSGDLTRQDNPSFFPSKLYFSGGAGLWSTPEDYLQFAQMLVNGGQLNGKRLLSPRTVELMGSNHVGDLYSRTRPGMGFGLTVEVVVDPVAANRRQSAGSFGWDGAYGTHFWADRKEQLAGILLIQQALQAQLNRDFENAVMQAIVE